MSNINYRNEQDNIPTKDVNQCGPKGPTMVRQEKFYTLDNPIRVRDNWKHRSTGLKCATCMWFVHKEVSQLGKVNLGRCRKHAPSMTGYPTTFTTDWCGDHKLDENKL